MSEDGGLGALLGAYNSDSDSQDQKSTGHEKLDTQAEDVHAAPNRKEEEPQAHQQEDSTAEGMLLDDDTAEIAAAPEEGPQRPPSMDPEAAYGTYGGDDDNNNNEEDKLETKRIHFDTLPPELATPPSGECDPEVQARVARWLELQRDGRRLTDTLRASRDYRNPEFFKKMVEYWEIDDHGTAFPEVLFDPGCLPEEDSIEALKKEWTEEDQRKKAARAAGAGKIEFTTAGDRGGNSSAAATATATAAAIKAAQAMAAKLAANRGGGGGGGHKR